MPQLRALLLPLVWMVAAGTVPAWAQAPVPVCPGDDVPAQIEVLPFTHTGNTCDGFRDIVSSYGGVCRIQGATYSGPDAIYKVRLNPGHDRVAFRLEMEPPADLVLALLRGCGQGGTCVVSSPDFIGSRTEEISAASYPPGVYYLAVDSADDQEGGCGSYTLTVTGVNPTPDLVLEVSSSRSSVEAGEILTYVMTVTNVGASEATDVQIVQTLPAGVTFDARSSPGCASVDKGKVHCRRDRLEVGPPARWHIAVRVKVDPDTRGLLKSQVTARSAEGDPTLSNNMGEATTPVIARSDLSIEMNPSRSSVVAGDGQPLTYTLRARNAGPSNATQVVVTDALPKEAIFVSAPGCTHAKGRVTCKIGRLAVGASVAKTITVNALSSARELLSNTASVAALEETAPANNVITRTTEVVRRTDLSVTMTGPETVVAGEEVVYTISVENLGPSDSAGATATYTTPPGFCIVQTDGCADGRVSFPIALIPRGGRKDLSFQVRTASSLRRSPPSNKVSVEPEDFREHDPIAFNNTSKNLDTRVLIRADLELVSKAATPVSDLSDPDPGPVVAGENLLYTLKVQNNGPSDSSGGVISDTLPPSLKYVSSPDDCEETGGVVRCEVPALPAGGSFEARFVVKVLSGVSAAIDNRASVDGSNDDPKPANNTRSSNTTAVEQKADVTVTLSASPDPLAVPGELTYTFTITNAGPSNALDVLAVLELPDGVSIAALDLDCFESPGGVECRLGDLAGGSPPVTRSIRVTVTAVPASRTATAMVIVSSATPEPDATTALNNTAEATTTLAISNEADLTLKKSASADSVRAGAPVFYTLVVSNRGPAKATGVRVEDRLPGGTLTTESQPCAQLEPGNLVVWNVGDLDKDTEQRCTFGVIFPTPSVRFNEASVSSPAVSDPDPSNNTSHVTTTVTGGGFDPPASFLVLPYFEADSNSAGPTTHFAVRNPSEHSVCARYAYILSGQSGPVDSELSCIASRAVDTRNLRDLHLGDGQLASGHVEIKSVQCAECVSLPCTGVCTTTTDLAGDFFRVDSSSGPAGGELLLSMDPARRPPDLCERWDVRFSNGGSVAGSTEIVFYVPKNTGSGTPVARGKVYTEAGDFVQTISIESSAKSFHRTTEDLLASAGSIEWTFRDGLEGNVSVMHRSGKNAAAVPGVCRRPPADRPLGDEKPLLLPYYAVDRSSSSGATTLFAVRNGTDREVQVHYEYFSSDGTLQFEEIKPLAGHATRTVNLRDIPGLTTGFARITAVPDPSAPERREQILSGDYIRLAPVPFRAQPDLAAGSALIDTDPLRAPRQLCRRWDVRFIQNARTGRDTVFAFYLDAPTSGHVVTGRVFQKDGTLLKTVSLDVPPGPLAAFETSASDLGLAGGEGAIEWDLGLPGHVATVFESGGSFGIMLVPGVCRSTL